MKNYNENIVRLIQLYLSDGLTVEERKELELWCEKDPKNQELLDTVSREELFSQEYSLYQEINEEKAIRQFEMAVDRKHYVLRQVMKYAAILILPLLTVVIWQWDSREPVIEVTEVIEPGSSKAVLTLAGGQQVSLTGEVLQDIQVSDGIKIKQEVGVLAYSSVVEDGRKKAEYNTLATGRGGEYKLVLADGTKVFLNSASTLKYPVVFNGKERRVVLEGEAYFEVVKDGAHAFIVETKGVDVKVYGTSFNINTYRLNEIQTVLVEGKIGVRAVKGGKEYRVQPGQMVVWNRTDGSVELKEVDVALYTSWKDGLFRFNRERLEDILTILSNWYDVNVFYRNQAVKDLHFSGYMERYDQIGTILEAITETTGVQFVIQGRTITVSK